MTDGDVWTIGEVALRRGEVAMTCGEVASKGRDVLLTGVEAVLPDENVTLNCGVIITYASYIWY